MSKVEDKAKEFLKKLVSHATLYEGTIDELEVYEPDDVIWAYKEGYHQAEKDLALTWKDISKIISIDQQVCGTMGISDYIHNHQQAMEEVLKRFNRQRNEDKH